MYSHACIKEHPGIGQMAHVEHEPAEVSSMNKYSIPVALSVGYDTTVCTRSHYGSERRHGS
jgi:hypothetical protein